MSPSKRQVEDALEILLYLGVVRYDGETARYQATEKAMNLDDEQIHELLERALGPRWRQTKLTDRPR